MMGEINIIEWSKGNAGALSFLISLDLPANIDKKYNILNKIRKNPEIRGWKLYVLYSDVCNKNMETLDKLCTNCPDDLLVLASSKQDYSGRDIVKNYL